MLRNHHKIQYKPDCVCFQLTSALHAEDVSPPVNRQADRPRQLQLVLQETPHLLGVENITEHPDLHPPPLDVGIARRQPGAPDRAAQSPPHLQGGEVTGLDGLSLLFSDIL